MPQPSTSIKGKIIQQAATPLSQGKTLYSALVEIPPEGRERTAKHLKLTTYSSTMHGQLTELKASEKLATLHCLLHSYKAKNAKGIPILHNLITPITITIEKEEQQ